MQEKHTPHPVAPVVPLFAGRGEMRGRFRSFDWSWTPMGSPTAWSVALRVTVETILGSAFPSVLLWGPQLIQLYNDGYREVMGAKHPGGLGIPTRECWPEAWTFNEPIYERVWEGETVSFEDVLIPIVRYGTLEDVYFTISYSPVPDDDGRAGGVLVTLLETTARVRERALEEERKQLLLQVERERNRLGELFAKSPSFLAVLRGDAHVFELANESYLSLVGRRNIVGKSVAEALPEAAEQGFVSMLDDVVRTGRPFIGKELPVTLRDASGAREVFVDFVYQPIEEADGTRSGIVVHGNEVTDQVRARREVEQTRRQLSEVFAQAPVAIAVLEGPEHRFTLANASYEDIIGRAATLGVPLREALPELVAQGLLEVIDDVYRTGVPFASAELRLELRRGTDDMLDEAFFNVVYQPLRDAGGVITGVIALGIEVTSAVRARQQVERLLRESEHANAQLEEQALELELANQQLQDGTVELEAQAEELQVQTEELRAQADALATQTRIAEAANRAKADFLATMSHELRTPLNAISGYTDLLLGGIRGPLSDPQRQDIERVRRSGTHLLSLINDLLNFAKLDAGQVEFNVTTTFLADVLAGIPDLVAPQVAAKSLQLDARSCAATVQVCADSDKVRQVMLNLLTNAVKFTPAGGKITVWCDVSEATAEVHVRDTGRGIPRAQHERVFDPFVQVDRHLTPTSQQGVGLGLAISRDLMRGMNGDLSVDSEVGVGSTFTLTLQRAHPRT